VADLASETEREKGHGLTAVLVELRCVRIGVDGDEVRSSGFFQVEPCRYLPSSLLNVSMG
jgi:hypothetical protein